MARLPLEAREWWPFWEQPQHLFSWPHSQMVTLPSIFLRDNLPWSSLFFCDGTTSELATVDFLCVRWAWICLDDPRQSPITRLVLHLISLAKSLTPWKVTDATWRFGNLFLCVPPHSSQHQLYHKNSTVAAVAVTAKLIKLTCSW